MVFMLAPPRMNEEPTGIEATQIVMATFPSENGADQAVEQLKQMASDGSIEIIEAAVIKRAADGETSVELGEHFRVVKAGHVVQTYQRGGVVNVRQQPEDRLVGTQGVFHAIALLNPRQELTLPP